MSIVLNHRSRANQLRCATPTVPNRMRTRRNTMARNIEIPQRESDGKWAVYAEVDHIELDRDWYGKNQLPCPQMWITIAVTHTKDAAIRAVKQFKF